MKPSKSTIIIVAVLFFVNVAWGQGKVTIKGNLLNNRFNTVQLLSIINNDPTVFMEAAVDPDGNFVLSGTIPQTNLYRLSFSDKEQMLCSLQPNDNITLTLDADNLSKIIAVSGSKSVELTKKLSDIHQSRKTILDSINQIYQENREQIHFNQINKAFVQFQRSNKEIDDYVIHAFSDAKMLTHTVDQYADNGKVEKGKEDSLLFASNNLMKSFVNDYQKFKSYIINIRPTYNFPPSLDAKYADYNQYIAQYMDVLDERHELLINNIDSIYTQISDLVEKRNMLLASGKTDTKKSRNEYIASLLHIVNTSKDKLLKTQGEYLVKAQASENLSKEIIGGTQARISAIMEQYRAIFDQENQKINTTIINLINENKDDLAVMMFIDILPAEQNMELHKSVVEALYAKYPGNAIVEGKYKQMTSPAASTGIGAMAPELAFENPDGKIMKLSDLRGKYVLIDFWASWCGPCRRENPHVVQLYGKYKDRGFEVYSVSLDRTKDAWIKAIEADRLTWPNHVSDLKYWSSEGAKKYGVSSIPATFLIDKEGRIIAKNLRGADLANALEQVLGK
ncbi:MAG: AhpC/TSA family protein [Bacteroidales bacterium]|jgi:thiol-disulfide isomerase/thioredoxin|nr:AhpC/TSA family protein [Bacteroidales bacterium]